MFSWKKIRKIKLHNTLEKIKKKVSKLLKGFRLPNTAETHQRVTSVLAQQ